MVALAVVAASTGAEATPAEDLSQARNVFRSRDYAAAIPMLNVLLYPKPRLAQTQDLIESHVLLGVSLFETGERERAARELEEALYLSAELSLDPTLFSAEAVRFFDRTKSDLETRNRAATDARRYAEDLERLRQYRDSLRIYEVRPYYINFVPFGAGQFQNGHRGKGLFFAAAQGATAALSAGLWLYQVNTYGFSGQVPPGEASDVLLMQQVGFTAGVLFYGLYSWSVVDAMVYFKPRAQIRGDDSLLPPELRDLDKGPRKPAAKAQLHPAISPGYAGLSLSWEH